jgi:predicted nucleic acid-binding protein
MLKKIIQLVQDGIYEGYVADITLLNIDYVAKKQMQEVRKSLHFIEKNFVITGADNADNNDMLKALLLDNCDLEDNIQSILAIKSACDLIVSNDKSFVENSLPVLGSELFLMKFSVDP